MFDWNDLRYFLAVAREGSTLAAARALGVDATTVQRRLAELERRLGRPLFARDGRGSRLTEFGTTLLVQAEQVAASVQGFERQARAARDDASGVVRVTCPEPLALRLQASPLLESFHARHPGVRVEFVLSDRYLDLMKGEADIALRSGDTDDGALVGRKIGDSQWGVYASPRYLAAHGRPSGVGEIARHELIGFDDSLANHRASVWLRRVAPQARFATRNNSVLGIVHSARAGMGLAPLPLPIGDAEPELERVLGPIDELSRIWRILTTPELRHVPRVAAFFDHVVEEVDALRPILGG
jgi:DNA-binding transcriptional LysR family regulator